MGTARAEVHSSCRLVRCGLLGAVSARATCSYAVHKHKEQRSALSLDKHPCWLPSSFLLLTVYHVHTVHHTPCVRHFFPLLFNVEGGDEPEVSGDELRLLASTFACRSSIAWSWGVRTRLYVQRAPRLHS